MPHAALLAALLPPVSYAASGPHLAASLQMEGRELDRLQENAAHAMGGLRPFLFQEWLEEYERVYGLPGPCSRGEQLLQERIAVLAAALLERGGISAAWIRRYAALAGYEVAVQEYRPFRAGHSRAGDALTNGDWIFAFLVIARGDACRPFRAGQSVAGEALRTWGDSILECIINWRKPAHTVALVAYIED